MKRSAHERFTGKVCAQDKCWVWKGSVTKAGYGQFIYQGRPETAHRAAWLLFRGRIPKGWWVMHKHEQCSKLCVNPTHLKLYNPKKKARTNRLTAKAVREIRELYVPASDRITAQDLASKFNTTAKTIYTVAAGESDGSRVLTPHQVRRVRDVMNRDYPTVKELSERYQVSQNAILNAALGRTWTHLEEAA